jgi:hypothetical protein
MSAVKELGTLGTFAIGITEYRHIPKAERFEPGCLYRFRSEILTEGIICLGRLVYPGRCLRLCGWKDNGHAALVCG